MNTFEFIGKLNFPNASERRSDGIQVICTTDKSKIFCKIPNNKHRAVECFIDLNGQGEKTFNNECDFAEYVIDTIKGDRLYKISGVYDIRYDPYIDKFYTSYTIRSVCDTFGAPHAMLTVPFCFQTEQRSDIVTGWHLYYDSRIGDIGFMPMIVVNDALLCLRGNTGILKSNITVDVFNGTKYHEITAAHLEEHDLHVEEAKAKYHNRIAGYVTSEMRLLKCGPILETAYTIEDMRPAILTADIDCDLSVTQMQYRIRDMYDVGSTQYKDFIKRILHGSKLPDITNEETLQYMMRAFRR